MSTVKAHIGHQKHSFELYPTNRVSRSKFDRSHNLITTMNAGYIVPIWHDIAYPGDTLILNARTFSRLATQIVPFMSNVYMDVHFWCVPIRLIWQNWVKMNGEQENPGDSTDYLVPQVTTDINNSEVTVGSIFDYFNIPLGVKGVSFNSLNFRAYNLVYNEWYRDENLQNRVVVPLGDSDSISNYTLLKRGKRKDYFTGALPWPQKGNEVDLPLGSQADVIQPSTLSAPQFNYHKNQSSGDAKLFGNLFSAPDGNAYFTSNGAAQENLKTGLVTDLSSATSATINSLRQAFAMQRMLERDARGGTRYIEMILSHFGVKSSDARLQRPEFLGGATFDLNLNIVPQTSATSSTSPLGELASYGTIFGQSKNIVKSFEEHCIVFGVASIRSEYYYQQGLERDYSKRSRIDYYLPVTANLGEQAVLNKEIYCDGSSSDDGVFGYQERWSEMRYKNSYITGQTRSTASQPLDIWHLAQKYNNLPTLSSQFIEENPPINRVIALSESSNTPQFICNFYFDEKWVRPMPVYSIPSMASHY